MRRNTGQVVAKDQFPGAAEDQGKEDHAEGGPLSFALLASFQFGRGRNSERGSEHHPDSLGFQEAHAGKSGEQNANQR